ncbi:endoglucanase-5 [Folsomia candida]|uniref:Cellulase n=1 Tax=Folsomia candida TaxID=158441 RepID=A0A226EJL6_FOLCA|nr:endoglucanase-5 [Folsomia candida]OXA57317.1 Endoglucanase-5 [Folsomia candida]
MANTQISSLCLAIFLLDLANGAVNWNGNNWAMKCDFNGNNLSNVKISSDKCGGKCAETSGCTHFTWTNYNGGTCWMKSGNVSPNDAFETSDSSMVCGYMETSGGGGGGGSQSGKTTRYWDCCKPSCSWNDKAAVTRPVKSCAKNGIDVLGVNEKSGCDGGPSYTCNNQIPFVGGNNVAYGFAAANIPGSNERGWCCACYELTFTSGPVNGQKMVVQVTNTGGDLGANHFDLQIPGGGVGIFNGCQSQWNAPANGWGDRYGGVSSIEGCNDLPAAIREGCKWRFVWFKNADNPTMTFRPVTCPSELTSKSGCIRTQ